MYAARRSWLIPLGVFAAVLAVVVAFATRGGGPGSAPRKLPIGAAAAGTARTLEAAGDAARLPGYGYGGRYRIVATLPDDLPEEAPAYRVAGGRAGETDVRRVAAAFGLTTDPKHSDSHWLVTDGTYALSVQDYAGLPWSFGWELACKYGVTEPAGSASSGDTPVSSDGSTGAPAPTSNPTEPGTEPAPAEKPTEQPPNEATAEPAPVPPDGGCARPGGVAVACPEGQACAQPSEPPAPSDTDAKAVAVKVLTAAGYDVATWPSRVEKGWGTKRVTFDRVVGGLPALYWGVTVEVDTDLKIVSGMGHLADPAKEDVYPLLTPQQAVDRANQSDDVIRCMALTPECTGEPPTQDVTAVRLGLTFQPSYDDPQVGYLIPAWLLTVKSQGEWEQPVLALPDEYLEQPPTPEPCGKEGEPCPMPAEDQPMTRDGGGSSGSTGSAGGTDGAAPPEPAPTK